MKLSDFNQISNNSPHTKVTSPAWDLIFVCLILLIASSSFIYDSYQEANLIQPLKSSQIKMK